MDAKKINPLAVYENARQHLLDELRWLNGLLAAQVLRLRRTNFYDRVKDFRDFFTSDEEIDALLIAGVFEADGGNGDEATQTQSNHLLSRARQMRQTIDQRLQASMAQKIFMPLGHLVQCFGLNEFERRTLLLCLAPQIDARYEKLYAYLQNDLTKKLPSLELIFGVLGEAPEERLSHLSCFHPAAPLRYYRLIESAESELGTSAAQRFLRANFRILQYVIGNNAVDEQLLAELRFLPPLAWEKVVLQESLQKRVQTLFQSAVGNVVFYFHGRPGIGKKTVARALCGDERLRLVVADMRSLLANPAAFPEKVRLLLREGLLQPAAIYFDHFEKLESAAEESPWLLQGWLEEIAHFRGVVFLGSENPLLAALLDLPAIHAVVIPAPDLAKQKALWRLHLNGTLAEDENHRLEQLTARFDLTGGQIAAAARRSQQSALARDPSGSRLTIDDVFISSRIQSQPKLSTLARKIEPKYEWDDIVLPEPQTAQLRELVNQVKYKPIVLGEWGFANKLSLGCGHNALFAGPSGTGKTMAAEVIASDLQLDLFKIDLSGVVSKYIGETEKNLNRVFTEAEHSNAILFFDEADALLGKRSEVKDAHDRYANIEISYLLQKMEEYQGVTILATNLKKNIDDAFVRRIQFIIDFPFPDEIYREKIWRRIFPHAVPLGREIDFAFLARQFKLTGGNIKNIALKAAYFAAAAGGRLEMEHLTHATKRELQNMGKLYTNADFGPYGHLA